MATVASGTGRRRLARVAVASFRWVGSLRPWTQYALDALGVAQRPMGAESRSIALGAYEQSGAWGSSLSVRTLPGAGTLRHV